MHFDFNLPGKLAAQVIDVNASTPVYEGRILACE
jgi:hypothetical protein